MATNNRSEFVSNAELRAAAIWRNGQRARVDSILAGARYTETRADLAPIAQAWATRQARERRAQKLAALCVRVIMAIITVIIFATLYPPPA